jgi:glutamate synthase domain-containing protein 3
MQIFDLEDQGLRALNQTLHDQADDSNQTSWEIINPRGSHAIAVGLDAPIEVKIKGSTGYYCGGMNKQADILVEGSVGPGVAENMMSGTVVIEGDASQYAGATGRGGLLVIKGNASSRCGISMKGINIVVMAISVICRPSWRSREIWLFLAMRVTRLAIRSMRRSCSFGER